MADVYMSDEAITDVLVSRLKARREMFGLTQEEATSLLPDPKPQRWWIGRLESKEVAVKATKLFQLARLYRVPVGWLIGEFDADEYLDLEGTAIQMLGRDKCKQVDMNHDVLRLMMKVEVMTYGLHAKASTKRAGNTPSRATG